MQGFAELVQARVDSDERTDDSAEQYSAEHVEQVRGIDRELDAHRGHEQTDTADDVLPQPFGQTIPDHRSDETAEEHSRRVEECSGEGDHEGP